MRKYISFPMLNLCSAMVAILNFRSTPKYKYLVNDHSSNIPATFAVK